jgi:hypothetical protein
MKDKRDTLRIVFPGKAANGRQTLLHEFVAVGIIDGEVAQDVPDNEVRFVKSDGVFDPLLILMASEGEERIVAVFERMPHDALVDMVPLRLGERRGLRPKVAFHPPVAVFALQHHYVQVSTLGKPAPEERLVNEHVSDELCQQSAPTDAAGTTYRSGIAFGEVAVPENKIGVIEFHGEDFVEPAESKRLHFGTIGAVTGVAFCSIFGVFGIDVWVEWSPSWHGFGLLVGGL